MPDNLNIARPTIPTERGAPLPERWQNITITEDQNAILEYVMRDAIGNPVDLSVYDLGNEGSSISNPVDDDVPHAAAVRLVVREYVDNSPDYAVADATVVAAPEGRVCAVVPECVRSAPGIYRAAFHVLNASDIILFENMILLTVLPSVTTRRHTRVGPPTIPEIRLHLRDSAPEENYLLDTVSFSDAEIAACLGRCIDYWNEALPPLRRKYTTNTFPYRFHWLEGTVAQLFFLAAEWYQKNDLQTNAGGIVVSDMAKPQWYLQQASSRWATYKEWVRGRKVAENVRGGFGYVPSDYSHL